MKQIVVVGGSWGAASSVWTLREHGYDGRIHKLIEARAAITHGIMDDPKADLKKLAARL